MHVRDVWTTYFSTFNSMKIVCISGVINYFQNVASAQLGQRLQASFAVSWLVLGKRLPDQNKQCKH